MPDTAVAPASDAVVAKGAVAGSASDAAPAKLRQELPSADRRHLDAMSDGIGIMQHAIRSRPDPAHGYCTDDVARALQVDLLHARVLGWPAVAERAWRNVRFLSESFDDLSGTFRNFRAADGTWLPGTPSEDSQGRAMHALGDAIATAPDVRLTRFATSLFTDGLAHSQHVDAVRAQASVLLGCDAAMRTTRSEDVDRAHRLLASRLYRTLSRVGSPEWPWPEPVLTYESALLPRALIAAGTTRRTTAMVDLGISRLDWLIETQFVDGRFSPIGNAGWWPMGGTRARYDQQPIEATSMLLAAEAAHKATGRERYVDVMERAFGWFLGENDRGIPVAQVARGACFDGLTSRGTNKNQGAESTLVWLTAVEHIRAVRSSIDEATASPAVGSAGATS